MKNKLYHILCFCLLTVFMVNAQNRKLEKANRYFKNLEYSKAITKYETLVKKGNTSPEVYLNLGDANYNNANYQQAAKWYEMLGNTKEANMDVEHTYRYAQSLRSIKKYEQSDLVMEKLEVMKQSDQRAIAFANGKDYLEEIKKNSGKYTIKNSSINSTASDFAPSFTQDGIVFSTGRDTSGLSKNMHSWNKKRFLNLYKATIDETGSSSTPVKFSKSINTKVHESSTAFTKDGNTMYFTRNNEKSGKFSRGSDGISRLKIYKAEFINGKWKKITPLPFNSDAYSVAHPTLNKEENKLYFASDMPGSIGKSDIFVVDINKDGSFGKPKNLGPKVNTESKETFPFITEKNLLYFASDGLPGLGGLDIFVTDLNSDQSLITNLGEPINSNFDDFSFVINPTTKKGYFASNRTEGKGDDDIYSLVQITPPKLECNNTLTGTTKDSETGAIIANATVILTNANGEEIDSTTTDANGSFTFSFDCKNLKYNLIATNSDYERGLASFTNTEEKPNTAVNLLLTKINKEAPLGTDLAKYLAIEPIYFDYNKWDIRSDAEVGIQKILNYLNEFPEAKIRIGSHTDSRASKGYNIRLSDKRANSTMEYLIEKGIDRSRLSALGLGETMLTNHCDDIVICTEEEHQENRRSEFIIVE